MHECSTKFVDVYGFKSKDAAVGMVGRAWSLGFRPSVLFSVGWRCRTVAAVEGGKPTVYMRIGGPATHMTQWTIRPEVFSSGLRKSAEKSLVGFLSGDLRAPIRVACVCNT
jgi:hypothetical protein